MILRKSIAQFWHDMRSPQPPATPVVDPELERRAKKINRTLPQLHTLGISDAQIRELPAAQLESRVSILEMQMREQGIVEPHGVLLDPPARRPLRVLVDTDEIQGR